MGILILLFIIGMLVLGLYGISCAIFDIEPSGKDFTKWVGFGILFGSFFDD
jgi:hypothetical protein